jgi:hypothetical protein
MVRRRRKVNVQAISSVPVRLKGVTEDVRKVQQERQWKQSNLFVCPQRW